MLNSPSNTQRLELESSTTPEYHLKQSQNQAKTGRRSTKTNPILKHLNPNVTGAYGEMYVAMAALDRGAEVFKNITDTGKIDMIFRWKGMQVDLDVKSQYRIGGPVYAQAKYMTIVVYNWSTGYIDWLYAPEGWEDFWTQNETTD